MIWPDGKEYKGEFAKGVAHGFGVATIPGAFRSDSCLVRACFRYGMTSGREYHLFFLFKFFYSGMASGREYHLFLEW